MGSRRFEASSWRLCIQWQATGRALHVSEALPLQRLLSDMGAVRKQTRLAMSAAHQREGPSSEWGAAAAVAAVA
jgi:hypothetical protein